MKMFDKNKIYNFSEEIDNERYQNAYNFIDSAIGDTINIVAKTAPITAKEYEFFCVNELGTGCEIAESDMDLIFAVTAPQIELNTNKLEKNKFKKYLDRIKYVWKTRKTKKNKTRKKKLNDSTLDLPKFQAKYNAINLKNDIINQLRYYFSKETILYNNSNKIYITSKNEIGCNLNIYICLKGFDNEYMLYDSNLNKFININLRDRFKNINNKNESTNGRFLDMIRLFNTLFYNIKNYHCNQILIESVFYNIPDEIYLEEKDHYNLFIKCLNLLMVLFKNIENFTSVCDLSTKINDESLCNKEIFAFEKFLFQVKSYLKK